jgi:hypothetical protein
VLLAGCCVLLLLLLLLQLLRCRRLLRQVLWLLRLDSTSEAGACCAGVG